MKTRYVNTLFRTVTLGGGILLLSGCGTAANPAHPQFAAVTTGNLSITHHLTGSVVPAQQSFLRYQGPLTTVSAVDAKSGSWVQAGQVVGTLKSGYQVVAPVTGILEDVVGPGTPVGLMPPGYSSAYGISPHQVVGALADALPLTVHIPIPGDEARRWPNHSQVTTTVQGKVFHGVITGLRKMHGQDTATVVFASGPRVDFGSPLVVSVTERIIRRSLLVPASAIQTTGTGRYFVMEASGRRVGVKVLGVSPMIVAVSAPLRPGTPVVLQKTIGIRGLIAPRFGIAP